MVKTIAIRNPRTLEVVADAVVRGFGRNPTEAAENLIERGLAAATSLTPGSVSDGGKEEIVSSMAAAGRHPNPAGPPNGSRSSVS